MGFTTTPNAKRVPARGGPYAGLLIPPDTFSFSVRGYSGRYVNGSWTAVAPRQRQPTPEELGYRTQTL